MKLGIKEIRIANPQGTYYFDMYNENTMEKTYNIIFENDVKFICEDFKQMNKLEMKLRVLGFFRRNKKEFLMCSEDEHDGLVQAHQNGENPFLCTIMCSNPLMNEVNGNN